MIAAAKMKNKCVICNEEIKGYGNNAQPYARGICCNKCNREKVIPLRLKVIGERR